MRRCRPVSAIPRPRPDAIEHPHPLRLRADAPRRTQILEAHRAAVAAGRDTYTDPASGFQVLTAAFLLDRGTCCDTGCRHCPYLGGPDLPVG